MKKERLQELAGIQLNEAAGTYLIVNIDTVNEKILSVKRVQAVSPAEAYAKSIKKISADEFKDIIEDFNEWVTSKEDNTIMYGTDERYSLITKI